MLSTMKRGHGECVASLSSRERKYSAAERRALREAVATRIAE
jgi:hypothetical protein